MDLSLFVRPGERITAALWNKLVAVARSCRIISGDGIRLRQTPDGTLISCSSWTPWNHPFKVSFSGTSATIGRGLVNGIEPKIDDVPIGGDEAAGKAQPKLEFKEPKFGKDGRGWIAIEVMCDKEKQWAVASATVVQVGELKSDDATKARHPIAMLRKTNAGSLIQFQIEFFNLQHKADVQDSGESARHFFWPA
jgi:hypothetical protein